MRSRRFIDLPLFGKFLLPFLALVVVLGALGTFLVVRDLSARAESELDDTLTRVSLEARTLLRDREVDLIESTNFAANLAGLAEAVDEGDRRRAALLLRSVIALKQEIDLLVVATPAGRPFLSFLPRSEGAEPVSGETDWARHGFVRDALEDARGAKYAGLVSFEGRTLVAVAGAVCSAADGCAPTGVAIVGADANQILRARDQTATIRRESIALYDLAGWLAGSSGRVATDAVPALPESGLLRRTGAIAGVDTATLYAAWSMRGERLGTIAVSTPTSPVFASVRGAGIRLALVVLAGMAGIVALGALVSRLTTSRVNELLETNRAIGRGELAARAPVRGDDELGELARGVNQMAEELQASRETLELRVQQRTEEVSRLMRERNEIFASLSHELRTPLATILRQAEIMLDPTYRKTARWNDETGSTIKLSAQQLLSLVNDILELARAEAGKMDVRLEAVDVRAIVDELQPTLTALARAAHLTLAVRLPASMPNVRADRRRLREVLLNLADNAVKYTPAGGTVTFTAIEDAGALKLSIGDTGVGIPSEARDRIFEPFYRVRGTSTQHGQASSGLGLALSKRLVEAQGGRISFTSTPREGSTFTVTLPAIALPSNGKPAEQRRRIRRAQLAEQRSR